MYTMLTMSRNIIIHNSRCNTVIQGSAGDVTGKRPGFKDFKGRAKYDAWSKLQGTSQKKAMDDYIALVEKLQG